MGYLYYYLSLGLIVWGLLCFREYQLWTPHWKRWLVMLAPAVIMWPYAMWETFRKD